VLPVSPSLFSPDGKTLIGSDGSFWDVADPSHPKQIPGLPSNFYTAGTATFSPHGGLLAIPDSSKITLYRVSRAGQPKVAGTIDFPATQVAFTATNRTLAAASYGGRIGFWDLSDPAKPVLLSTLEGRKGGDIGPVFSPNGHYVAIPENDGTTQVWNVQDPRHPVSFVVLDDATPVEFDPNGKVIAVYTGDGSLQLRQIDVTAAIKRLCAGTPTISKNKWSQYATVVPYQPPCGTPTSRP
jgi:WD40 repeat protein